MTSPSTKNFVTDDEVFRRKLLLDGEGMGDERRLTILMRNIRAWDESKGESDSQMSVTFENLIATLSNCEFFMMKSQEAQIANDVELQNYENLEALIKQNILEVQQTIVKKKEELKMAKKIRENKQQYDAVAKMIAELPDRKETEAKLRDLKQEIAGLSKQRKELENTIKMRHKEMQVLLSAAAHLKEALQDPGSQMDSD